MIKLSSPGGEPEVSRDAVVDHISRMRAYKPDLDAQVAVIEAALINYFPPRPCSLTSPVTHS